MRRILLGCLVLGLLLAVAPLRADEKEELQKLQGTWEMVSVVDRGKEVPADKIKGAKLIVTEAKAKLVPPASAPAPAKEISLAVKVDPSKTPKAIDLTPTEGPEKDQTARAIYQLDGDTLKLGMPDGPKADRPTAFEPKDGGRILVMTFKRAKP
jgi:uncharacterized protein (TIGR03067 family)